MIRVSLFVEDVAQENLVGGLIRRMAVAEHQVVDVAVRNAEGGDGRVFSSLKRYVRDVQLRRESVDVLVVAVDADKIGVAARRRLAREVVGNLVDLVLAMPDPYIERWYLLDVAGLGQVLEAPVTADVHLHGTKADLKASLRTAVKSATGARPLLGGAEHGESLAQVMDLELACRSDRQLAEFLDDLQSTLRRPRG